MRTIRYAAALSGVFFLSSCATPEESVPAKSEPASTALTAVPQTYQRMRFVSPAEQSPPTRTLTRGRTTARVVAHHEPVAKAAAVDLAPLPALVSHVHATVATSTTDAPAVVAATHQAPPVTLASAGDWSSNEIIDRRPGAAVIRGGVVGRGKCDALGDIKAAVAAERPTLRMPTYSGSVFGRGTR